LCPVSLWSLAADTWCVLARGDWCAFFRWRWVCLLTCTLLLACTTTTATPCLLCHTMPPPPHTHTNTTAAAAAHVRAALPVPAARRSTSAAGHGRSSWRRVPAAVRATGGCSAVGRLRRQCTVGAAGAHQGRLMGLATACLHVSGGCVARSSTNQH
jgi:hypothetical protein